MKEKIYLQKMKFCDILADCHTVVIKQVGYTKR